jgi:hypothetical protein
VASDLVCKLKTAVGQLRGREKYRDILVSIFFLLNIFVLKFELFGCVGTGNAPLN